MTVGAFLIARLGSSRLPAKNMMRILDKPVIQLLAERVARAELVDKVVIATSVDPADDPLQEFADSVGIPCYRGPMQPIMGRVCGAAEEHGCDTIVEILGDNLLIPPGLIDAVLRFHFDGGYDCSVSVTKEYEMDGVNRAKFILGIRAQIISMQAAKRYTEFPHLMMGKGIPEAAYLFNNTDVFNCGFFEATGDWSRLNQPEHNFSVNYQKNFDLVKILYEALYPDNPDFSMDDVLDYMDVNRGLYDLLGAEQA